MLHKFVFNLSGVLTLSTKPGNEVKIVLSWR